MPRILLQRLIAGFDTDRFIRSPREHYIDHGYGNSRSNSRFVSFLEKSEIKDVIDDVVDFETEGKGQKYNSLFHLLDSLILWRRYNDAFVIIEYFGKQIGNCKSSEECDLFPSYTRAVNSNSEFYRRHESGLYNFESDLYNYINYRFIYSAMQYFTQGRYSEAKWFVDKSFEFSNYVSRNGKEEYDQTRNRIILMKLLFKDADSMLRKHSVILDLLKVMQSKFSFFPRKIYFAEGNPDIYITKLFIYWPGLVYFNGEKYEKSKTLFLNLYEDLNDNFLKELSYLLYARSVLRQLELQRDSHILTISEVKVGIDNLKSMADIPRLKLVHQDITTIIMAMNDLRGEKN